MCPNTEHRSHKGLNNRVENARLKEDRGNIKNFLKQQEVSLLIHQGHQT